MFAYVGSSRDDVLVLHAALQKASACDPCLKKKFPNSDGHHRDGWGYVIRTPDRLFHYRTTLAIDEDPEHQLPAFTGEIAAIFHARFTSGVRGDPIFSHPYVGCTPDATLFLAHNGGLNPPDLPPGKVDSEWALDQIMSQGSFAGALPTLKGATKTALNILLMSITRQKQCAIWYLNWYQGRHTKVDDDNYQMYKSAMPGGGRAVLSSTLKEHLLEETKKGSIQPAAYDKIVNLCSWTEPYDL
jgi:predicted glutamine amidotransferase